MLLAFLSKSSCSFNFLSYWITHSECFEECILMHGTNGLSLCEVSSIFLFPTNDFEIVIWPATNLVGRMYSFWKFMMFNCAEFLMWFEGGILMQGTDGLSLCDVFISHQWFWNNEEFLLICPATKWAGRMESFWRLVLPKEWYWCGPKMLE